MTKKSRDASDVDWPADERPARWVARPAGNEGEDRLAALMRASARVEGLSAAAWERVWSRLDTRAPSLRWRSPVGLRWAIVMVMLLTSGGVIGAVTAHRWWPAAPAVETPVRPASTGKRRSSSRPRPARAATVIPDPAPNEDSTAPAEGPAPVPVLPAPPPPTTSAPDQPPRARARTSPAPWRSSTDVALASRPQKAPAPVIESYPATVPPPLVATPVPATALSVESRLLGQAVARLRQQRDAAGALVALDQYRHQFPAGTLQHEAEVARADALLMLGRDRDALGVLQTLRLQPQGRDQELRVIRGELSAASNCPRAVVDFDRLLSETAPAALIERALFGRAVCRARQGDTAGSARDLGEYLQRFPAGRFTAEARRSLRENNL